MDSPAPATKYGTTLLARDVECLGTAVDGVIPCASARALSVMVCLALNAFVKDGYRTSMSQTNIAAKTGWKVRSVQTTLDELEAAGLIARRKRYDGSDITTVIVSKVRAHALAVKAMDETGKVAPPDDILAAAAASADAGEGGTPTPLMQASEPSPALIKAVRELRICGQTAIGETDVMEVAQQLAREPDPLAVIAALSDMDVQTCKKALEATDPLEALIVAAKRIVALAASSRKADAPDRSVVEGLCHYVVKGQYVTTEQATTMARTLLKDLDAETILYALSFVGEETVRGKANGVGYLVNAVRDAAKNHPAEEDDADDDDSRYHADNGEPPDPDDPAVRQEQRLMLREGY